VINLNFDLFLYNLKRSAAARGFVFKKAIDAVSLKRLLSLLTPLDSGIELIRIGGNSDGGYIIPNDLSDIAACYSPGVSDSAHFEEDLLERFSIPSHLADFSVDGPPHNFTPKTFLKKFLGSRSDSQFITLPDWMNSTEAENLNLDFILQMDIEGAEYETILSTPMDKLERFRIIVLEIHGFDNWADPKYFSIISSFFEKLLQKFTIVHAHANNCCGISKISGIEFPRVFEISLIRNDRFKSASGFAKFPNKLDVPNLEHKSEIQISEYFV
jgi:hypothetical protein